MGKLFRVALALAFAIVSFGTVAGFQCYQCFYSEEGDEGSESSCQWGSTPSAHLLVDCDEANRHLKKYPESLREPFEPVQINSSRINSPKEQFHWQCGQYVVDTLGTSRGCLASLAGLDVGCEVGTVNEIAQGSSFWNQTAQNLAGMGYARRHFEGCICSEQLCN